MSEKTPTPADEVLSEKDLQALARRHSRILRKFRARREREVVIREQQAMVYYLAQQMAASMVAERNSAGTQNAGTFAARGDKNVSAENPAKSGKFSRDGKKSAEKKTRVHDVLTPAGTVAHAVAPAHSFAVREQPHWQKFLRKIGYEGLAMSVLLHLVIFIFAIFCIVTVAVAPKPEEKFFASGSGGGRGGERPSYSERQKTRRSSIPMQARERKVLSKAKVPQVALPEMPQVSQPLVSSASMLSGMSSLRGLGDGELSSGSGGGLGGGVGRGMGVGIGNARNFVGKFQTKMILGTSVTANRIAVYMDNSGSMTAVIPPVRKDILEKFPTADVYEFFGCGISRIETLPEGKNSERNAWKRKKKQLLSVFDREKTSSKAKSAQKKNLRRNSGKDDDYASDDWQKTLSSYGNALLEKWGGGSVWGALDLGSWMNMVLAEGGYDTIIVFADFQDYQNGMLSEENRVLHNWIASAKRNKMRLYLFTTEMLPQEIFMELARATGGTAAIPRQISKNSPDARETAKILKKFAKPAKSIPAKKSGVPAKISEEEMFEDDGENFEDERESGGNDDEDSENIGDFDDDSDF